MEKEHLDHGVTLHMESTVLEINKDDKGNATGVMLKDLSEIKADLIIVGVGIEPSTNFLETVN